MIYLIENPVAHLFPGESAAYVRASALSEPDRALWTRFSGTAELVEVQVGRRLVWKRAVVVNESNTSQFDSTVELAQSDAAPEEAFACVALTGSGFHGNRGRAWEALPGNLHFTAFLPLDLDAAIYGPALSMLPTLAVTDLIADLPGATAVAPAWIKWVNDVYLGPEKVSGSLVSTEVDGSRILSCVLGIGINLEQAPDLGADARFGGATSLKDHGIVATIQDTFHRLLDLIERRLHQLHASDGPNRLAADYRKRVGGIGRSVEIHQEGARDIIAAGRLLDVHPDLALEIEGVGRIEQGRLRFS